MYHIFQQVPFFYACMHIPKDGFQVHHDDTTSEPSAQELKMKVIDWEVIDLDPESEDEDVDELPMFGPEPPDHPLKVHCRTPSPCFWSCELCAGFVCDTCGGCCYCCTCSLMREHESDASFH